MLSTLRTWLRVSSDGRRSRQCEGGKVALARFHTRARSNSAVIYSIGGDLRDPEQHISEGDLFDRDEGMPGSAISRLACERNENVFIRASSRPGSADPAPCMSTVLSTTERPGRIALIVFPRSRS